MRRDPRRERRRSGRGRPTGGIAPLRTLRTTFSQTAGFSADRIDVELVQHQRRPGRRRPPLVVTGHAVAIDQRRLRRTPAPTVRQPPAPALAAPARPAAVGARYRDGRAQRQSRPATRTRDHLLRHAGTFLDRGDADIVWLLRLARVWFSKLVLDVSGDAEAQLRAGLWVGAKIDEQRLGFRIPDEGAAVQMALRRRAAASGRPSWWR